VRLFAPEGSAEGCASGECLPPPKELPAAERWRLAVESVRSEVPRYGKSLSFGRLVSFDGAEVHLAFPSESGFHRATVLDGGKLPIEKLLTTFFATPIRLVEEKSEQVLKAAPKSIAEQEATTRAARETSIEARVRSHPAVQSLLRVLGGTVEHVQVLDALPTATDFTPAPPPEDEA
jgi:hypothetical protein